MTVAVTSDESILISAARDFARAELLERDRAWDQGRGSVVDVLPELAEMGFLNLMLPEDVGGVGCSYRAAAQIIHEIAYASPSAAVTVGVHNMVGLVLSKFAKPDKRVEWLSEWGSAANLAAFAITEANAGSDPASGRTQAELVGDNYVINGEKMWITNGLTGRWFLTFARTSPEAGKKGMSCILVDGGAKGLARVPIHGKMGIRGSETATIAYTDVEAPVDHLIGAESDGLHVGLAALHSGRIGIAAQASGIAEACLDLMVAYAKEREQFGSRICEFQAIQNMVADSAVEVAAAKALIQYAAAQVDAGVNEPATSSKAKLYATEAANRIAYRAVQVHGGMGYVNECRVEQLYRDARVTTIYEGTSEIQRLIIARRIFGGGSGP